MRKNVSLKISNRYWYYTYILWLIRLSRSGKNCSFPHSFIFIDLDLHIWNYRDAEIFLVSLWFDFLNHRFVRFLYSCAKIVKFLPIFMKFFKTKMWRKKLISIINCDLKIRLSATKFHNFRQKNIHTQNFHKVPLLSSVVILFTQSHKKKNFSLTLVIKLNIFFHFVIIKIKIKIESRDRHTYNSARVRGEKTVIMIIRRGEFFNEIIWN